MISLRKRFRLGNISYLELAKRTKNEATDDAVITFAAAIAYYLLFALFPFLLFLATIIGYLPFPNLMNGIMDAVQRMLPGEASGLVVEHIKQLFTNKQGGLLSLGFLLALWSSSSAVTAVMDVMNRLYEVKEGRPFWKVRLLAIFLVITLGILFIVSLLCIMFGPYIGNFVLGLFRIGALDDWVWYVILAPVILFLLMFAVALIYYITPDVKMAWKWITPGSFLVIPVWLITSVAFSFYVNNFGSYNKTYGSIGAVIVLLLWLYLTALIILFGAEVNSVVEHSSEEGKEPGEKVEGQKEREPEQVQQQKR